MAKKPSLMLRANSRGLTSYDPSVDSLLNGTDSAADAPTAGLKSRITTLPNGRLKIETMDPASEAIHTAELDAPTSGSTDFVLMPNKDDEAASVLKNFNKPSKGSLIPYQGGSVPDKQQEFVVNGDSLGRDTNGKPQLQLEDAGTKAKDVTPDLPQKDAGQVVDDVVDYLHNNGLGILAKRFLGAIAPEAVAVGSVMAPTETASDELGDTQDKAVDKQAQLMAQTNDILANRKWANGTADTSATPPALDTSYHPSDNNGPTSPSEAPTGQEDDKLASLPVPGRKPPVPSKNTPSRSDNLADTSQPMSDEQIHLWNLQNNPSYNTSLYDPTTKSFTYNK